MVVLPNIHFKVVVWGSRWYYILTVQIMRITSNNCAFMIFHLLSVSFRAFCVCPIKAKSWIVTPNQATKVKTSQSIASTEKNPGVPGVSQFVSRVSGFPGAPCFLRLWPKLPRGHSTVHPNHPWPWPRVCPSPGFVVSHPWRHKTHETVHQGGKNEETRPAS